MTPLVLTACMALRPAPPTLRPSTAVEVHFDSPRTISLSQRSAGDTTVTVWGLKGRVISARGDTLQLMVSRAITDPTQLHRGFTTGKAVATVVRQPGITVFREEPDRVMTTLTVLGTFVLILVIGAFFAIMHSNY